MLNYFIIFIIYTHNHNTYISYVFFPSFLFFFMLLFCCKKKVIFKVKIEYKFNRRSCEDYTVFQKITNKTTTKY